MSRGFYRAETTVPRSRLIDGLEGRTVSAVSETRAAVTVKVASRVIEYRIHNRYQ
ncbi:hypothetical protein J6590_107043, partial [Homalodisca vitripennis]